MTPHFSLISSESDGTGKAWLMHFWAKTHQLLRICLLWPTENFAEGFKDHSASAFLSVVESFELIPIDRATAERYAQLAGLLRARGRLFGSNDLWIAAVALEKKLPLVTANLEHFNRVPELQVIGYR